MLAGEPTWWRAVTGAQPEERNLKPSSGQLQEVGPWNDRSLILSAQFGRIDWFLTPRVGSDFGGEILNVGSFPDAFSLFLEPMLRWLPLAPALTRLAFGAAVLVPVTGKEEGYRLLEKYLPTVKIDPVGSEDFFYQINRPRPSTTGIPGLRVNRLSKWSVAYFQPIKIGVAVPAKSAVTYPGERHDACRIELDISTPAVFEGGLPPNALDAIFRELVNAGAEIVRKGDLP